MIHCFPVKKKYLSMIGNGKKRIEVHIYSKYFSRIKRGDMLIMFDGSGNIARAKVLDVRVYRSFKLLLDNENLKSIFPECTTKDEVIKALCEIYKISERKLLDKKAIAIEIELLDYIPMTPTTKTTLNGAKYGRDNN